MSRSVFRNKLDPDVPLYRRLSSGLLVPSGRVPSPSIGGSASPLSGTFAHGNSLTLTGTGFGTKSTAAPLKYDDFQSVTTSAAITTSSASGPSWSASGTIVPIASAANVRSGTPFTKNMLSRFQPVGGSQPDVSNIYLSGLHVSRFVFDAWFYHDFSSVTSPTVQNMKPWRIHSSNAGDSPNHASLVFVGSDVIAGAADGDSPDDGLSDYFNPLQRSDLSGSWVHMTQITNFGTAGTANGTSITRVDFNGMSATASYLGTRNFGASSDSPTNSEWATMYIGNYVRSEDWGGTMRTYWESVYFDQGSWARIEVGDNATYTSCTHREIQIPSAWSSSSVSFTVNRGSFGTSDSAWIFVIDNSNTVVASQAATFGTSY